MRLLCPPRCLAPLWSDTAVVLGVFAGVSAIGKLVRGRSRSSVSSLSAEPAAEEEAEAEVELGPGPMPADGDAIVIRDATPADADTLAAIAVAAWGPIRRRQAEELGAAPPPLPTRPAALASPGHAPCSAMQSLDNHRPVVEHPASELSLCFLPRRAAGLSRRGAGAERFALQFPG
jgi:hypothetical protein